MRSLSIKPECECPAYIDDTVHCSSIFKGSKIFFKFPCPNCPSSPNPKLKTSPSVVSSNECAQPAATLLIFLPLIGIHLGIEMVMLFEFAACLC